MASRKRATPSEMLEFPLDVSMKKPARIAAFLDWWANRKPNVFVAYNQLLQVVEGYKDLPSSKSPELKGLKNQVRRAELILNGKRFNREIWRDRLLGVRATVDDFDKLKHVAVAASRKTKVAINRQVEKFGRINIDKIPSTPETKPYKDWGRRDSREILKMLSSPQFQERLLPRAIDQTKKDEPAPKKV